MQKQVTPAMIVVALIILVIIIGLLWYFTMGRKPAAPPEGEEGAPDPAMMDDGAREMQPMPADAGAAEAR